MLKKKVFRLIMSVVLVLLIASTGIENVYAQNAPSDQSLIFQEAWAYDPDSSVCSSAPGLSTTGVSISGSSSFISGDPMTNKYPMVTDKAAFAAAINAFIQKSSPNSPWLLIPNLTARLIDEGENRNVNPMLITVIGRQESTLGTSDVARRNNNSFGDKGNGPGGYRAWPSFEASLFGDGSFMAAIQRKLSGQHPNYVNVTNMYEYLSVHVSGQIIYPGDSTTVYDEIMKVPVNVDGVLSYYENAQQWISEMTGYEISGIPQKGSMVSSYSSCSGSQGVINGNLVQTALNLAWTELAKVNEISEAQELTDGLCSMRDGNPSGCGSIKARAGGMIRESDAKPEYVSAVKQFNPGNDSDGANWAFSDCGVYVATVVRASGTDTNYAARGTGIQLDYVNAHPEMFDIIAFTDTSQAQPGDWFINDGHTYIYAGPNQLTTHEVADASWGQHVPTVNRKITIGDGYYRIRKKP